MNFEYLHAGLLVSLAGRPCLAPAQPLHRQTIIIAHKRKTTDLSLDLCSWSLHFSFFLSFFRHPSRPCQPLPRCSYPLLPSPRSPHYLTLTPTTTFTPATHRPRDAPLQAPCGCQPSVCLGPWFLNTPTLGSSPLYTGDGRHLQGTHSIGTGDVWGNTWHQDSGQHTDGTKTLLWWSSEKGSNS